MDIAALSSTLVRGVVVFASTNVDDIVLLSLLFADRSLRPRSVVIGQYLGIGVLVFASALAALAALTVPPGWTGLLGIVPLGLGLAAAVRLLRASDDADDTDWLPALGGKHQVIAVAGITLANGGDNVGVYIPLFAAEPHAIAGYCALFGLMTGLWCVLGARLVDSPLGRSTVQRYGRVALPIVLVVLGVFILLDARVLL